ncbi:hypothetical protein FPQ18DRAFT_332510 [Pyronema domesticum]|uniref:Uncharacterized protein n=1 Tax=Pyronema omphalodes (strain CBS 100304) TaxID=1076935 RepID=U4LQ83_PYROM|nr:hypothetical protein FPQ18DRAFT_332510 [Pyronema domesticum]CCX17436.1 Similar to conserved hypothetical protein [Pyrenophora tritici-repentis Pt-1C-BFP]; acc. no. XP_001937232 [Pyronema omphalodes CBS 100304]
MCNGFSTRTSLGGAIAILHPSPTSSPSSSSSFTSCQLHFTNDPLLPTSPTSVSTLLDLSNPEDCELRIHDHGDLTCISPSEPVMYSLPLRSGLSSLERRLDLGVGGKGIIGRAVSIVAGGAVLGQGIVGWN